MQSYINNFFDSMDPMDMLNVGDALWPKKLPVTNLAVLGMFSTNKPLMVSELKDIMCANEGNYEIIKRLFPVNRKLRDWFAGRVRGLVNSRLIVLTYAEDGTESYYLTYRGVHVVNLFFGGQEEGEERTKAATTLIRLLLSVPVSSKTPGLTAFMLGSELYHVNKGKAISETKLMANPHPAPKHAAYLSRSNDFNIDSLLRAGYLSVTPNGEYVMGKEAKEIYKNYHNLIIN